jgi:hypothetical protein
LVGLLVLEESLLYNNFRNNSKGAIMVLITLFKAYFQLLISVVLGPLQITLGAIPGITKQL